MNMRPGMFLLSGFVSALTLLGASTAMAQEQPAGGSSPSPPAYEAPPPSAPGYAYPPPPPGYGPPPSAPGYGYPPPAPGYGPPPPAPGYGPPPSDPAYGYPPPAPGYGYQAPALGYHQHDGFYLRLHGGGGYLSVSGSSGGSTFTLSGGAGAFSVAIGAAVIPNLVLYGEFLGMIVSDPTVSQGGSSGTLSDTTMAMIGFGPGVAYYIEPFNMYLSSTLTFTRLSVSDSQSDVDYIRSNVGFGFSLEVGKEWWVSTDWGLGAAFQFQFASMKEKYSDAQLTGLGFVVLFSATYN